MAITVWKNISVLRGFAMLLVVLAHSAHLSTGIYYGRLKNFSPSQFPFEFLFTTVIQSLVPICLPLFIFASGFTVYQMFKNFKAIRSMAFQILRKYLIWAIPLYFLISLKQGTFDIQYILCGLIKGGPMAAYWFLVLIIVIYLTSPIWINLVKGHPRVAIILSILVQCLQWLRFYYDPQWVLPGVVENIIVRPLLFTPPFVAGMFLASRVKEFLTFLKEKRTLLKFLTACSAFLCIVESILWGYVSDWDNRSLQMGFSTERLTLTLFFACTVLLLVSMESKKTIERKWLSDVGMASLGILFMMDICLRIFSFLLWHVPHWICNSNLTAFHHSTPPLWLVYSSPWILILYFVVGLWGPLYLIKWGEKLFGYRIKILW